MPTQNPVSFLGVKIDQRLTWASQVDQVCARACSGIYALRRLVTLVADDVLRMAYFSLVHSHLTYGMLLWGGSYESKRAFIVQKKAVRVMVRRGIREHCKQWFRHLNILTLPSTYIYVTCLRIHSLVPSLRTHADIHAYNTRGCDLLLVPFSRTNTAGKNKVNIGLYNALPNIFKALPLSRFKSQVKLFLIDKAYYSIDDYLKDGDRCTYQTRKIRVPSATVSV